MRRFHGPDLPQCAIPFLDCEPPTSARQFTHAFVEGLSLRVQARDRKHKTFDCGVMVNANCFTDATSALPGGQTPSSVATGVNADAYCYGEILKIFYIEDFFGLNYPIALVSWYHSLEKFDKLGLASVELVKHVSNNGTTSWAVPHSPNTSCIDLRDISSKFFTGGFRV